MANLSTPTAWVSKYLNFLSKWFLYLAILVWPFGLFLKTPESTLFPSVYFLDLVVFLLFVVEVIRNKKEELKKDKVFLPLLVFLFVVLISMLVNFARVPAGVISMSFLYYLRVLCYPAIYFAVKAGNRKEIGNLALVSFFIFLGLGIGQYLLLPDLRVFKNIGFDDHYYRLAGSLLDPNFAGAVFSTVAIYFLVKKKYFVLAVTLVALGLTFSRASYLAFFIALVIYSFNFKAFKVLLVSFGALCLVVFFAPKPFGEGVNLLRTYSIYSRLETSRQGITLFFQKPSLGFGFGQIVDIGGALVKVDNSYIYLLASTGIAGFLGFVWLMKNVFLSIRKEYLVALVPILVHSIFNNTFFYIFTMSLFWFLAGMGAKESKSA